MAVGLFGFFRRRQKMVMIIMAVLMVSFLIGFQGFSKIFESKREFVLGQSSVGKLTTDDRRQADSDIRILGMLGLGSPRNQQGQLPTEFEYRILTQYNRDPALSYALLMQEARKNDIRVGDDDINSFLVRIRLVDQGYQEFLGALRRQGITEDNFRDALGRWLQINRLFAASLVNVPPSESELSYLSRDLFEKINVRALKFNAAAFLGKVDPNITFTEDQIKQQFEQYSKLLPGQLRDENSFGFGYLQPRKAKVEYLLVSRDVVARVVRPSDADMLKYYNLHKSDYVAEIPASAPGAATQQAVKSYSQAKADILRDLTPTAVNLRMDELTATVARLIAESRTATPTGITPYQWVHSQFELKADELLDTRITVSIQNQPLDQAVETLARLARLNAIAFPYSAPGDKKLDPGVKVSVLGQDITLKDALEQVVKSANWLPITWGACKDFDRMLFPVGGEGAAGFFPVSYRQTQYVDPVELQKDPVLGHSFLPVSGAQRGQTGAPLMQIAFTAEPFVGPQPGALRLDADGPVMDVSGERSGKLMWRVVAAQQAKEPDKIDDTLRKQIVADLRLIEAYKLADQAAGKITTVAQFESAAAGGEANVVETGLFSRIDVMPMSQSEMPTSAVARMLDLPDAPSIRRTFLSLVFEMAPKNIDPPYPPSTLLSRFGVPSAKEVLVLREVGFEPLVKEVFETQYRPGLLQELWRQTRMSSYQQWFDLAAISARVGYRAERAQQ